jgi:glycosyltransferase involved in cell wall biosynthesis
MTTQLRPARDAGAFDAAPIRVALVYPWYGEHLGYIENCLPVALASLGADVHLITSDLQPGFASPQYATVYEPLLGPAVQPTGVRLRDGYTHHRLPHVLYGKHVGVRGLSAALRRLRPDVVQTSSPTSAISLEAALLRPWLGYRLFTGNHQCASTLTRREGIVDVVRRAVGRTARFAPGRAIALLSEGCFAVTEDAAELAVSVYGVPASKVSVSPLGVDTSLFHPSSSRAEERERDRVRTEHGVDAGDVLCIYTGRMTEEKNPLLLAQAVAALRERGLPFRGVFIGGGAQAEAVAAVPGNRKLPYLPYRELPAFYRAADIAVWPAQESSSQADAIACGLPTILSDQVRKQELFDAGAVPYRCGDLEELTRTLLSLAEPGARLARRGLAEAAVDAMSWRAVAERRLREFRRSAERPRR